MEGAGWNSLPTSYPSSNASLQHTLPSGVILSLSDEDRRRISTQKSATDLTSDDPSLKLFWKKGKEASQVFSPPCYSPFGESD